MNVSPDLIITAVAAVAAGRIYTAGARRLRRHHHHEHGASTLLVLAVALVVSITVLTALHSEVPPVLSQALTGVLFGIGGGEISLVKAERAGRIPPRKPKP